MSGRLAAAEHLRALCRTYVRGETRPWTTPSDPTAFLDLARQHRLTPLLWGVYGRELAGDPLAAALRHDARGRASRGVALLGLARPLLSRLASAGVPVIALKGVVLGERHYRDPAHRPMDDVDLLVRRADVARILDVARELGLGTLVDEHSLAFDLRFGSALVLTPRPGDVCWPSLDLHWRLVDAEQFTSAHDVWHEAAWAAAEPATIAGVPTRALSPEHLVLYLAAHLGTHHAFGGLLWYCDLALVAADRGRPLDWDMVGTLAARFRLRGVVALALEAAAALFDDPRLAAVARALRPASARWRLARRLVLPRAVALDTARHLEPLLPLLLIDRARDCARTVARRLAPGRTWVTLRYGTRWPRAYLRHGANALGVLTRAAGGRRSA